MTNKLPAEYTPVNANDGSMYGGRFSTWKAAEIVRARIKEALDERVKSGEVKKEIVDAAWWSVKVTDSYYSTHFTRVYVGSTYRKDKVMLSSKKNESIDLDKVINAIIENGKRNIAYDRAEAKRDALRRKSEKLADSLSKQFGLDYNSATSVDSSREPDYVVVTYKVRVPGKDAEELLKLLTSLKHELAHGIRSWD